MLKHIPKSYSTVMVHMYFEIEMVNTNKPIIFWCKSQNSDATFNFANEEKLFHFPSTGSAVKKYNIRNFQVLSTDFRRTVNYGIETITYRAPSLWAKLPLEYKLAASLEEFKVKIEKWKCDTCP